jgi:hemerythrin-like domain-containing protein
MISEVIFMKKHMCLKPRGCLMIEHRLIERAIEILTVERDRLKAGGTLDPVFIDKMVDFIRTYADRTHHGKEEDILFESLESKDLSPEEKSLMRELIDEHRCGRELTQQLVTAKDAVLEGDKAQLAKLLDAVNKLVEFYPEHIRKEDERFFPDTERHYDKAELDAMLHEFYDFDMQMIHEKYRKTVESIEEEKESV